MKHIKAIIKPYKLHDVQEALTSIGIEGMTVTEVTGFGRQRGHTEIYQGSEYCVNFLPKLMLDIIVTAEDLDRAVKALSDAAKTGKIGDGKLFILPLDEAIRIRTSETGDTAIHGNHEPI